MDRAERRRKAREHPVVQAPRSVPRANRRRLAKPTDGQRTLTGRPDPAVRRPWGWTKRNPDSVRRLNRRRNKTARASRRRG